MYLRGVKNKIWAGYVGGAIMFHDLIAALISSDPSALYDFFARSLYTPVFITFLLGLSLFFCVVGVSKLLGRSPGLRVDPKHRSARTSVDLKTLNTQ
jgi:hypothetical protein